MAHSAHIYVIPQRKQEKEKGVSLKERRWCIQGTSRRLFAKPARGFMFAWRGTKLTEATETNWIPICTNSHKT